MVSYVDLKGFEKFSNFIQEIDSDGPPVLFLFSGSKLPNGNSWCPDCVEAEPIVKSFLGEQTKTLTLAYVDVGDQEYWRDRACPFRTDTRTKLMVIPTILKWNGVQRLEGSQCSNRDLLQMLVEDED